MATDINGTLLNHLATGPGAAWYIRTNQPKIIELVRMFFQTRTDVRRLSAAQDVAKAILELNDFNEFIEIRDIVAKRELRRQISYGKQQDHTAHTVYLYLLGIWFYDHLPAISTAFGKLNPSSSEEERDMNFVFQWLYASLLHDIGYAFNNLEPNTKEDREAIDNIYSLKWTLQQFGKLPPNATKAIKKAHAEWYNNYGLKMKPGTSTYAETASIQILERLAEAPWVKDLHKSLVNKDIFKILGKNSTELRDYAFEVANEGYGGNGEPCVDHAVASGLLLFQYTSYWYWLLEYIRKNYDDAICEAVSHGYNYNINNIITDIIPACRAAAYHNVLPVSPIGKKIIPSITLQKDPLLFLAILSDELQKWDRLPAGWMNLESYQIFSHSAVESEDISLVCNNSRENPRAGFIINFSKNDIDLIKYLEDFRKTLSNRLPNYDEIIDVYTLSEIEDDLIEV